MTSTVHPVDPTDEAALRAWWDVGNAASAERPVAAWPVWEISRAALPMPRTDSRNLLFVAEDGVRAVGAALLTLFRHDNTHLGEGSVWVHPEHRRRGHGRALLERVEESARAEGRRTVISTAYAPVDAESPGSLFAAATGYSVASAEETKTVDLTTAPAGWPALDAEVAAALGGYRVEVVQERIPDEYVDGLCALLGAFIGEIPSGDLELEDALWTPERLREGEDRAIAIGALQVVALAVAPDGELCGFSDLRANRRDPRHASVGGTLVLPGHRGHRLGLAMKLGTHRRIRELLPDCGYVQTGNAGVNAAMNRVNAQLGYRVVERAFDVQKSL